MVLEIFHLISMLKGIITAVDPNYACKMYRHLDKVIHMCILSLYGIHYALVKVYL